jgi:hypothetical protein
MIVHSSGNRESALFSFVRSLFSLLKAYPGCAGVTMSPLTEVRKFPALPLLNWTTRDWHGAGQQVLVAQASGLCAQPGWLRHQKPHS